MSAASSSCASTSVRARAFDVPTDRPEADGTLSWTTTTVVVVQVSAEGTVGTGWTYASTACVPLVEGVLATALDGIGWTDVGAAHEAMVRACRNLGRPGLVGCAISAVDVALWDLKARLLDLPLVALLGRCEHRVPVYGSGGFTTYDDEVTTRQLERFAGEWGCRAVKLKIAESWGTEEERDLARVALARQVVGDDVAVMVDANGGYHRKQAIRLGRQLVAAHAVSWFEEPVSSQDLDGLRLVRDTVECEVAAGEYLFDERDATSMLRSGAVDVLQVDATRCGGYTSWLRAAATAAAFGLEVSAHCAPSLHAHVAGAVPNLRHVEYFWDHHRADALLFEGALTPSAGSLVPDVDAPGHGMVLREADAAPLRAA